MTEDYKHQITQRVREAVSNHIERMKQDHPELLLTKQWRLFWPKGFQEGMNCIPVVTSSKQGQYLVGEVQFVLPPSMELDPGAVELSLKDEPFQDRQPVPEGPASLDEPLDLLNDLVAGINGFLQSLNITVPAAGPAELFRDPVMPREPYTAPLPINKRWEPGIIRNSGDVEEIMRQMRRSPYLPDWYESIQSQQVAGDLLRRLAEGYLHYQRQVGRNVSLEEYFRRYSDYLLKEGKLHHYCKYKGKPVHLDSDNWCSETYCSKKPFHSECSQVSLRFGAPSED